MNVEVIGPYRVLEKLGEGGMGEVYRARDTRPGRNVALKVLPDHRLDSDRQARFEREDQVVASLSHPNIAAIHGLEHVDGRPVLVLELVEGPTLADRIAQGSVPQAALMEAMRHTVKTMDPQGKSLNRLRSTTGNSKGQ